MGEAGRLRTERPVELDVLGGVGEMILSADHVGDLHLDVIDDTDEVEDPGSVRTAEREVGMGAWIGQVEFDFSADLVVDDHLLAGGAESDRAVVLVEMPGFLEAREILLVDRPPFALVVGAVVAALLRSLVPVEAQPVEPVEDDLLGLLSVAAVVGVLDAEDKRAGVLAGVDPVEEGGAGSTDMEEAGR